MTTLPFATIALCLAFLVGPVAAQLAHGEPEWYLRTSDGCRLFVQEFGRGKDTVVVLHGGWGAEHSYLFDAFKGLEERYRLVFYDQRGSLRSPCSEALISVEKHVEDLERLRIALGLERMTLFGHSMGTTLAMAYLNRYPERVKGLVLASLSAPRPPKTPAEISLAQEQETAKRAFFERPEVAAELRRHGLDRPSNELSDKERSAVWRIRFAAANLYHVDRWRQLKGGIAYYSESAGRAAEKSMPKEYDFTPALAAHPCPVWVIEGDHDFGPLTVKYHRSWSAGIKNIRLHVIEKAGHNAWIDAPTEFRRALFQALGSTTRCG